MFLSQNKYVKKKGSIPLATQNVAWPREGGPFVLTNLLWRSTKNNLAAILPVTHDLGWWWLEFVICTPKQALGFIVCLTYYKKIVITTQSSNAQSVISLFNNLSFISTLVGDCDVWMDARVSSKKRDPINYANNHFYGTWPTKRDVATALDSLWSAACSCRTQPSSNDWLVSARIAGWRAGQRQRDRSDFGAVVVCRWRQTRRALSPEDDHCREDDRDAGVNELRACSVCIRPGHLSYYTVDTTSDRSIV